MGLTREAPPKAPAAPRPTRVRPVVLATLSVRVDPSAERMAIDSALEAGAPLILVNLLKLRNYPTTIALLGRGGHNAAARGGPRRGARNGGACRGAGNQD